VLLLFVFLAFCKGPNQTDQPKDGIGQVKSDLSDGESIVVNSNGTTSPYGPTTITRKIKKDKDGNLLIAAYEGIIRYDGNSFTNFTKEAGLDTCYAFDVMEDQQGNIWIASDRAGAFRYDGKSFTNFTTRDGLAHNRNMCLYEDKAGNIWIGGQGGVSRYDGKSFTNFTTKEGLPHNDVGVIIEDKTGKFWFGTRDAACIYDGRTFTKLTNKEGVPFIGIVSIIEDKKGNIWLGGKDGLWRYNGSSFTNFTTTGVSCVYEDKKGNIWTTNRTNDPHKFALSRNDEKSLLNERATAPKIRIEEGMFFGILEDNEGSIWVGTLEGVFRYDGKSFSHFKDPGTKK
jgi:ligand-binding sensor domain-containing protein